MRFLIFVFLAVVGCGGGEVVKPSVKAYEGVGEEMFDEALVRMRRAAKKLNPLLKKLMGVGREAEFAADELVRGGIEALAAVKADWEDNLLHGEDVWETLRRLEAVYTGDSGPAQRRAEDSLKKRAVGVDVREGEAVLESVASALAELNGVGAALTPSAREKSRLWGGPFRTPEKATLDEMFRLLAQSAGLEVVWRFGAAILCTEPDKVLFTETFELDIPEYVWKELNMNLPQYGWEGPVDALLNKMRESSGVKWELAADPSLLKYGVRLMMPAGSLREQMGIVALAMGGRWVWQSGGLVLRKGGLEIDTVLRKRNRRYREQNLKLLPKLMAAWRKMRNQ